MLADYLCIEHCRECGALVPPLPGQAHCACARCWGEHNNAAARIESCPSAQPLASVLVASGTTYSGVLKKMIYGLKYDGDKAVIHDLIGLTNQAFIALKRVKPEVEQALLIPVPLHWMRSLVRGYNQAELIAEGVAKQFQLKVDVRLLSRRRATKPQHGLGRQQRQDNIAKAFRVNRWAEQGAPPLVIVDDLYTSGATISEAASLLAQHGFSNISAITAARAVLEKTRGLLPAAQSEAHLLD